MVSKTSFGVQEIGFENFFQKFSKKFRKKISSFFFQMHTVSTWVVYSKNETTENQMSKSEDGIYTVFIAKKYEYV